MNMKKNRKGFTIVEMAIVIAVIAILATAMLPTFTGIIEKAQESKLMQKAAAAYTSYVVNFDYSTGEEVPQNLLILIDSSEGRYAAVVEGGMNAQIYTVGGAEFPEVEDLISELFNGLTQESDITDIPDHAGVVITPFAATATP